MPWQVGERTSDDNEARGHRGPEEVVPNVEQVQTRPPAQIMDWGSMPSFTPYKTYKLITCISL